MVLEVVALERDWEGNPDRQVGEDAEKSVGQRSLNAEARAVGNLVNTCKSKASHLGYCVYVESMDCTAAVTQFNTDRP